MRWFVAAALLIALAYWARAVVAPFIIAAMLAYIFSPIVDRIEQRTPLPRIAVVAGTFTVIVVTLGLVIWLIEGQVAREVRALSQAGPDLIDTAFVRLLGSASFQFLGQEVDPHLLAIWANARLIELMGNPTDAFRLAGHVVETLLSTVLALVAFFYLLLDGQRVFPYLLRFMPPERRDGASRIADEVHQVLARYLRGQLILIALMSAVTYLVLAFVFRLPYALPIAIFTGVLEVIPLIGPVAAAAVASVVALVHGGPGLMVGVIVAYFVLRQAEDQLVMPIVVGHAVELHPLVTTFAVLVGAATGGILGALLGVPVAAAIRVLVDYLYPPPAELVAPEAEVGSPQS